MNRVQEFGIEDVDKAEWNYLLSRSEVCDAFQTYEWAQTLSNSSGVRPHFLIVRDSKNTIGGEMFFERKTLGVLNSYEARGGPLYIKDSRDIVLKEVMKVFREKRKRSMYSLHVPSPLINHYLKEMFQSEGYNFIPFYTIIVDLTRPLEQIWAALDKQARWGVRKAERLGVEVSVANTWREWKEYYDLHVLHSRESHYSTDPYSFFEEMFKLHSKNMSRLFLARFNKQIIAGSLFLVYKKNMIFLQNASLRKFLKYNPNNLIQWESIKWAKEHGVEHYDINGLPWEKTPYLRGIYQYKKRWDGRVMPQYYYLNNKILCSAVHLVRSSFVAWRLFSGLKNLALV